MQIFWNLPMQNEGIEIVLTEKSKLDENWIWDEIYSNEYELQQLVIKPYVKKKYLEKSLHSKF